MLVLEKLVGLFAAWDVSYQFSLCLILLMTLYWAVSKIATAVEAAGKLVVTLIRGWPPVAGSNVVCKCKCECNHDDDDDDDDDSRSE